VTRVQILLLIGGSVIIFGVLFSFTNEAKPTGVVLHGYILSCSVRVIPRHCWVALPGHRTVSALIPFGRPGTAVSLVEMRHPISQSTYYTASTASEHDALTRGWSGP